MNEILRKLYRCLGLIFPILYLFYSKNIILIILGVISAIFVIFEILRFKFSIITKKYFKYLSAIAKEREKKNISGTTYVLISELLTVILFEKSIAITAIFFLILGDAASSLIGKYGRIKIWNKTLEGSISCFIVCFIVGMILLKNIYIVFFGALAATLIELIPIYIKINKKKFYLDDNLSIGLVSGLVMSLV